MDPSLVGGLPLVRKRNRGDTPKEPRPAACTPARNGPYEALTDSVSGFIILDLPAFSTPPKLSPAPQLHLNSHASRSLRRVILALSTPAGTLCLNKHQSLLV